MKKWISVNSDGWIAVYIDDVLVHEGHNITTEQIFNLCNEYGTGTYESIYVDDDLVEEYELWDYPTNINELPEEILKQIRD